MAPKIYWTEGSPPARAVMMVAHALKVRVEEVKVNVFEKENRSPEFLKKNPGHTIPILEDKDLIIRDSHAILTYLVTVYGKDDSLYPKDPKKRAKVDSMLHFDSSTIFSKGKVIVHSLMVLGEKSISQDKIDGIVDMYGMLEAFLSKTSWIALDQLTVADFCCFTSLLGLDLLVRMEADKFPKLAAWFEKCSGLPGYQEICIPGHNKIKALIEGKLKEIATHR